MTDDIPGTETRRGRINLKNSVKERELATFDITAEITNANGEQTKFYLKELDKNGKPQIDYEKTNSPTNTPSEQKAFENFLITLFDAAESMAKRKGLTLGIKQNLDNTITAGGEVQKL